MDKIEAQSILSTEIARLRTMSYAELQTMIGSPRVFERLGESGTEYQIEVEAFWDHPGQEGGDLRVLASIDDGRILTSIAPLCEDFIVSGQ